MLNKLSINKMLRVKILLSLLITILSVSIASIFLKNYSSDLTDSLFEDFYRCIVRSVVEHSFEKGIDESRIIIIDIDFESCQLRRRMPNYVDIAQTTKSLIEKGARCVILDIAMDYKTDPVVDSVAADIFKTTKNVVFTGVAVHNIKGGDILGQNFRSIGEFAIQPEAVNGIKTPKYELASIPLPKFVENASSFGFANVLRGREGYTTHVPLFINLKGQLYPSAVLAAYCKINEKQLNTLDVRSNRIIFGDDTINSGIHGLGIRLYGKPGTFTCIPFYSVSNLSDGFLNGKIILIGRSATNSDYHLLNSMHTMFGTEVFANLLYGLLYDHSTKSNKIFYGLIFVFVGCSLLTFFCLSGLPAVGYFFGFLMSIGALAVTINLSDSSINPNIRIVIFSFIVCFIINSIFYPFWNKIVGSNLIKRDRE